MKFAKLLDDYEVPERVHQELFKVEMRNIYIYGYGIKEFVLSILECALDVSDHKVPQTTISEIVGLGKGMIEQPIELLPNVVEVISELQR